MTGDPEEIRVHPRSPHGTLVDRVTGQRIRAASASEAESIRAGGLIRLPDGREAVLLPPGA
jgi:hypothetical protein